MTFDLALLLASIVIGVVLFWLWVKSDYRDPDTYDNGY